MACAAITDFAHQNVSWASYIELQSLGDCLLTATPSSLAFTRIMSLKKLHIKKVGPFALPVWFPLISALQIGLDGYIPVTVAYDEHADCFGIAAVAEEIDQEFGDLVRKASFHVMSNRDQISRCSRLECEMMLINLVSLERF